MYKVSKILFIIIFLISGNVSAKSKIIGTIKCSINCNNIQDGIISLKILDSNDNQNFDSKINSDGSYTINYPSKYSKGKLTIRSSNHIPYKQYIDLSKGVITKNYMIKNLHKDLIQKEIDIVAHSEMLREKYNLEDETHSKEQNESLPKKINIVAHTKMLREKYILEDETHSKDITSKNLKKSQNITKSKKELFSSRGPISTQKLSTNKDTQETHRKNEIKREDSTLTEAIYKTIPFRISMIFVLLIYGTPIFIFIISAPIILIVRLYSFFYPLTIYKENDWQPDEIGFFNWVFIGTPDGEIEAQKKPPAIEKMPKDMSIKEYKKQFPSGDSVPVPLIFHSAIINAIKGKYISYREKKNSESKERNRKEKTKDDHANPYKYLNQGHDCFDKKNWSGAIKNWEMYIKLCVDDDATALTNLSVAYHNSSKWNKSIYYANRALALTSSDSLRGKCFQMLFEAYYHKSNYENFLKYIQKALKIADKSDFKQYLEIVMCPKCNNQYSIPLLSNTGLKIRKECKHCGWIREFIDKEKTKPGFLFYVFGIITIIGFLITWIDYPYSIEPFAYITFISAAITLYFMQANKVELLGETYYGQVGQNYPKNSYAEEETVEQIGFGSGFLVSKQGIIITNYHVIEQAKDIKVHFPNLGTDINARVITQDKENDIAILVIDTWKGSDNYNIPFQKANKSIRSGQNVHTIGYPLGNIMGEKPRLTSGVVSSPFGIQDDPRYFQVTTPIQSGNSGGVVFTDNGEAVGIIVASINDEMVLNATGTIAQNINFALKFDYVEALLRSENLITEYRMHPYRDMLLEDLVSLVEPVTCQIIKYS